MVSPGHPAYAQQCEQQAALAAIRAQLQQDRLTRIQQHNQTKQEVRRESR